MRLQVLDNLGLVRRLDARKHLGVTTRVALLARVEVVELAAAEGASLGVLVLGEDADAAADGLGRVLVVAGDHDDADARLAAALDGVAHLCARRVEHADDAHECDVLLVVDELVGVLEVEGALLGRRVDAAERQTAQSVAAGAVLVDEREDLGAQRRAHGQALRADAHVCASLDDCLRGALDVHARLR